MVKAQYRLGESGSPTHSSTLESIALLEAMPTSELIKNGALAMCELNAMPVSIVRAALSNSCRLVSYRALTERARDHVLMV